MGDILYFYSGEKSFEIHDISEDYDRWFAITERRRGFVSKIKVDGENLRWVCDAMLQASLGKGNLCRKWGRKIQAYRFRVLQNFNIHGRFLRIEAWLGDRRNAIIIPENDYNWGWSDIANKIKRYLGNSFDPRFNLACQQSKSYMKAANITRWPEGGAQKASNTAGKIEVSHEADVECTNYLSKCLIGKFNDPCNQSPNAEVIQKWFLNRWKVTAGLKVIPINHNLFLFELPSRQEAVRVKAGDWYWKGRHLTLEWWSPVSGSALSNKKEECIWLKAFGIPLHGWSMDTFRAIGNHCGGFLAIDEDTKLRNHLFWARICVRINKSELPHQFNLVVGNWSYDISIIPDVHVKPQIGTNRNTGDFSGASFLMEKVGEKAVGKAGKKLGLTDGGKAAEKAGEKLGLTDGSLSCQQKTSQVTSCSPKHVTAHMNNLILKGKRALVTTDLGESSQDLGRPFKNTKNYYKGPNKKRSQKGPQPKTFWKPVGFCTNTFSVLAETTVSDTDQTQQHNPNQPGSQHSPPPPTENSDADDEADQRVDLINLKQPKLLLMPTHCTKEKWKWRW